MAQLRAVTCPIDAPQPCLAVVVGAGPGMGLAVGRRFAARGLPARRWWPANPSKLDLTDLPTTADPVLAAADVGDEAQLRAAFATIRAAAGDPASWSTTRRCSSRGRRRRSTYDVAHRAARRAGGGAGLAQEVAPAMRAAGSGTIVFTGGGTALRASAGSAALASRRRRSGA